MLVFSAACKSGIDAETASSVVSGAKDSTVSCMSYEYDNQNTEFYGGEMISVDDENSTATYNDRVISYSWSIDKWYFEIYKGYPKFEMVFDGVDLSFFIIDEERGIVEDLGKY